MRRVLRPSNAVRIAGKPSAPEAEFAYEEARRGLGGVMLSLDCRWLNHPARAADAEYKPWQLGRAGRAGLKVPRTLVTNRPGVARDFARSATDGVICKPLFEEAISEDGKHKTLYTTRLGSPDLADFDGVESTAHLFQDWVPKDHEVRLTVVGVELFAVAIRSTSAKGYVDWRSDYDALEYETLAEVPPEVSAGVRRFLRSFGLSYGAFDFVITPAGGLGLPRMQPQWPVGLAVSEARASDTGGHCGDIGARRWGASRSTR